MPVIVVVASRTSSEGVKFPEMLTDAPVRNMSLGSDTVSDEVTVTHPEFLQYNRGIVSIPEITGNELQKYFVLQTHCCQNRHAVQS